ncbi:23S rRNA (guanosine(2251)-2'-O)-methyltransferase RlmB [Candidatus Nomurabacteria bacterium CG10_big_fil_rev_8_21_14_0_10_35_16]|uniref:23S rRNA (Guanosine(2251)-2'-O)-methyltransferase RlmB n=1 Tax=Candidatus Nomurabacteria bacterium CG10_big_fil_rev_8_21_14_0_10_35_16 TaxID=1974731 RepID=A0A2H0TBS2_9BACT|nr:MAG: 23S rRNA (guanosine(2251)-2'-O)-methyltransferase RlmB [Candidatus Nomurabacteria bacterium CG10_big_fil_rev_8_21_14_0_10_35_16]
MKQNKIFIYGKHALKEALINRPEAVDRVFLSKDNQDPELKNLIRAAGATISPLGKTDNYDGINKETVHQGVVARIFLDKLMRSYKEFINELEITPDKSLVILGELKDPQNVGAIIRSAAAFGVSGILVPEHRQAPITGTVAKVSAGMVFRVPLVNIGNVGVAVKDLKEKGFWVYGLDGEAKQSVTKEEFSKPSVFILGNEAKGIRLKTKEACDILLSVPMSSKAESLNVAASAAVTLYAWSAQHPEALK